MSSTTAPRASGSKFSPSISPWGWSPASPWNSSSAPTGRASRSPRTASLDLRPLAMEGVYGSFFLESAAFWACFYTERNCWARWDIGLRLYWSGWVPGCRDSLSSSPTHGCSTPLGYALGPGGSFDLAGLRDLLMNPWVQWQYPHVMLGAVATTARFAMASTGAFYLDFEASRDLRAHFHRHPEWAARWSPVLLLMFTGDGQGQERRDLSANYAGGHRGAVRHGERSAAHDPWASPIPTPGGWITRSCFLRCSAS